MRLVVCLFLIWVYYALGQNKYREVGVTLRKTNCTAYGFFDYSIKLPGSKTRDCIFTCYCIAKNKVRCKEYEPIVCGNKVGIDKVKTPNSKENKIDNRYRRRKASKESTSTKKNVDTNPENKRVKRAFGLGDIFFRDAVKETLNRADPQQCKPYQSSYSEGCPPDDWCVGCTVCDCDANGYWDCHTLSFCPDGKNGTEALKKPIKWQNYAKRPPIEGKKKIKKPKRPSKSSPNSKSRRRKIQSTTTRPVKKTSKPRNKLTSTKKAKLPAKDSKTKKINEISNKTIAVKKLKNLNKISTKKPNRKPTTRPIPRSKKFAINKFQKKAITKKANKKVTTTVSPRIKEIEKLLTDEEKASKNFTRELAQEIAKRYIASIKKVITKNNDILFADKIKQKISEALPKKPEIQNHKQAKRSKNNQNVIYTSTEKRKRYSRETTPLPFVNEDSNESFYRKKRCVHGDDKVKNHESAEFYYIDGKHNRELRVLNTNLDTNITDDEEYYKYSVQTENGLTNTVNAPEPIALENVTDKMFIAGIQYMLNNTIKKPTNQSDHSPYNTTAASTMLEVLYIDENYFSTSEKPSDVLYSEKLTIANNGSLIEQHVSNKLINNNEFDIPVMNKKYNIPNGPKTKDNYEDVDIPRTTTGSDNFVIPKYILDGRKSYYDATQFARNFIINILRNESALEKNPNNIKMNNVKLIKEVCNIFGPCKFIKNKKKILKYKMSLLNNETVNIVQILKTVKGLLKLINETRESKLNLVNGTYRMREINKLYYINENETNLTESDKIILRYLKDNIHIFINSFKRFVKILNTIFKIITSPKTFDSVCDSSEKHMCGRRRNHIVRKLNTLKKQDNLSKDPLDGLKDLLKMYKVFQNTFLQNIYEKLSNIQMQITDSKRMKKRKINEENEKVTETRKKIMETYTDRIKESLRKINDIAESINTTMAKRVKRSVTSEDDLTTQYLLFLMEYLLRKNKQTTRRSKNDIDYLIDAIQSAPKMKSYPFKNEVYKNRKKMPETSTKLDVLDLYVVTGSPQSFYSPQNKERVLKEDRKSFSKYNELISPRSIHKVTVETPRDDYFMESNVKNKFEPVTQMEKKTFKDKIVSSEESAENEVIKSKENETPESSSPYRRTLPKAENRMNENTLINPNYVYRNTPTKSNFAQPRHAEEKSFNNLPNQMSNEQRNHNAKNNVHIPKTNSYLKPQPRDNIENPGYEKAHIKPISHEKLKQTIDTTTTYEKNNETDNSYVTVYGKVLKADINDEMVNPVDFNETNVIDNDSFEQKPKDEELINSFYKLKPIETERDGGIDNEDPFDKIEEVKSAGGSKPDLLVTTVITTIRPAKPKPPIKNIELYDIHGGPVLFYTKEDKQVTESNKVTEKGRKGVNKTKSKLKNITTTKLPPTRHPPVTAPPKGETLKTLYKTEVLNSPRLVWVDESSEEENYNANKTFIASQNTTESPTTSTTIATTIATTKKPKRTPIVDLSDMTSFTKVIGSNQAPKGDKYLNVLKHKTMNLLNSLDYSERPQDKLDTYRNRDDSDSNEDKRGDDFSTEY